ncbi:hypothetical protein TNCV_3462611 [Trichonephila clavipes]|nr:hypothetical protein TNCV_3462611 [Trichonephila clavipes]
MNHRDDGSWIVSSASSSSSRQFLFECEEVWGPLDKRDVIYTRTRLRMPSTDLLARRPSHHTSLVEPNALVGAVQTQAAPSLRASVSSRTIVRCLTEGHLVSRRPLRVLCQ